MTISWYSLDTDLRTVEHGSVDLDGAYGIIDGYLGRLRPHYQTGEEALAATMFGFTRLDGSYMQICVHTPDTIDVEYDFSLVKNPLLRFLAGRRENGAAGSRSEEHTSELQSRFDLVCRLLLEKKKTLLPDGVNFITPDHY